MQRRWMGWGLAALLGAHPLGAQVDTAALRRDSVRIAELERQVEALTRELEALRLGRDVVVAADTGQYGLGPAASKVYRVPGGVSIGGYGEILYENYARSRQDGQPVALQDQVDALRAILYVGYKFNERLLFNSELEWEHGSTSQGGEASIEFAYLDYLLHPTFGLRAGLVLAPLGWVNELHEPPIFLGTTRSLTESAIIPTTWRSNGVGFFGEWGPWRYRAYLMDGLDAVGGGSSRASGFSAAGLRGGRQKGARALIEDPAVTARLDFEGVPGVLLGASTFLGQTAQNRRLPNGQRVGGRLWIADVHADVRVAGWDLRGLYAWATLDDVAALNQLRNLSGANSIGERLWGGYVHLGYNLLRTRPTTHQLVPYVRYERLNTQARVPAGFAVNPANDRAVTLLGLMWKPIPQIAVKADYQWHRNGARTGVNQFNVNLGYIF